MKLGKVVTYQKGRSPQKDFASDNLILYLTPEYLRGNGLPNFIPDFPSKVQVEDGDLILLWDGSNAGEFFKGRKGILSSTMVKFKFNEEELQRDFLFYQLKAFEGYLKAQTNGSGIPHVDRELLLGIEVENFHKSEQTLIAQILSKADAAIDQTEALIAKYQRIKTGLMQDLLTRGIDENGNIRNKATHRFVIKNGIEVPEEWEVERFGNYISKIDSGWSPICESRPAMIGEWGSLKTTSVTWEGYNSNENKRLPDELSPIESIQAEFDDILITRVGPRDRVGVVVHVNDYRDKLMLSDNMLRVKIKPDNTFYLPFLPLALKSDTVQKVWKNQIAGLAEAQVVINQKAINSVLVPIPPKKEQIEIYEKHNGIKKLIDKRGNSIGKLQSIKTGLMKDLLSGKVKVNERNMVK